MSLYDQKYSPLRSYFTIFGLWEDLTFSCVMLDTMTQTRCLSNRCWSDWRSLVLMWVGGWDVCLRHWLAVGTIMLRYVSLDGCYFGYHLGARVDVSVQQTANFRESLVPNVHLDIEDRQLGTMMKLKKTKNIMMMMMMMMKMKMQQMRIFRWTWKMEDGWWKMMEDGWLIYLGWLLDDGCCYCILLQTIGLPIPISCHIFRLPGAWGIGSFVDSESVSVSLGHATWI